jgi:hypothetical protein
MFTDYNILKAIKLLIMINNLILITALVWLTMISCTPTQNDSKRPEIQQQTHLQQLQQQHQQQNRKLNADTSATRSMGSSNLPLSDQTSAKGMLNPAHGEPGHRCDIPVGSPLNIPTAAPAVARMNPPHGEPGHRCDIPVGSPL